MNPSAQQLVKKEKEIRTLALGVAAAVLFLAGWILLITPVLGRIQEAHRALALEGERQKLLETIDRLEADLQKKENALLDETSQHSMVGKVSSLAKGFGVQIQSLEPKEKEAPLYRRLVLSVGLNGQFVPLVRFLEALETADPPVQVLSLSIEETSRRGRSPAGVSNLSVQMELETLIRKAHEKSPV